MTRLPTLNSPFLLGFDEIERAIERVTRSSSDGYPPYNIERVAPGAGAPELLRITLAVAGFTRDQLEVAVEDGQLAIRGRQVDDGSGSTCIAASLRGSSNAAFCLPRACRSLARIS